MTSEPTRKPLALEAAVTTSTGSPAGQLRANPVDLDGRRAFLVAYAADCPVDPYVEMFFFPTDTLKLVLFAADGKEIWRRDLGRGVVPGSHFCPVYAFDLDGDGTDEIWYVNNTNTDHPLGISGYVLERLDARTGETTGQWPWPRKEYDTRLSHQFRNFIFGGHVRGEPVLVTAEGTYEDMHLQGWRSDMSFRWRHDIAADTPGARGSHMFAITDLDGDGVEEVMWGERNIELDTGAELFCADRDSYRGHSDVVQPVWDESEKRWVIYTCRESDRDVSPRVATFDAKGRRIWGAVAEGHMDMGWVARLGEGGRHVAMAIKIGAKSAGPDGLHHRGTIEYAFDVFTGERTEFPFSVYRTVPVDLDGDGYHELVRNIPGSDGEILSRSGERLGEVGGAIALTGRLLDTPGEQLFTYYPDGTIKIWADRNAEDTDAAKARYAHPFYVANSRHAGSILAGV